MLLNFMLNSPFASPWFGSDTACGAGVAPDTDFDCDVDLADFARFQACFNGPNRRPARPDCAATDYDDDRDVDLNDFAILQNCFNGPNRAPKC